MRYAYSPHQNKLGMLIVSANKQKMLAESEGVRKEADVEASLKALEEKDRKCDA